MVREEDLGNQCIPISTGKKHVIKWVIEVLSHSTRLNKGVQK